MTLRDRPGAGTGTAGPGPAGRVATTVVMLGVVSLLTDVSSEMISAVLPLYLTAELGLGLLAYGFIDGLYQGVSALVRILGGYLGDRGRQPKWVAVVGYGVSAVSRIAMLPAHTFAAITGVVTVDRLGKGLRTAPRDALIADSSDPALLGRSFGVHRTLDTIGASLGPIAAFALLLAVPKSYDSIFVVSFAVAIVGVAVLVLFVPNRRTGGGTQARAISIRQLARELTAPRLRRPMIAAGLLGLLTIGDGFLYLALQHRDDFAARYFPLLYVGTNVAYIALAIPLGRLADRVGKARVLIAGHVVLVAGYLAASLPHGGLPSTVLTLLLLGVFYAATDGVLPALISRLVPTETRGSAIASAQTVVVLARFASSVAFGSLWIGLGRGPALITVAGAMVVVLPVAAWLLRSAAPPSPPHSDSSPATAPTPRPTPTPTYAPTPAPVPAGTDQSTEATS